MIALYIALIGLSIVVAIFILDTRDSILALEKKITKLEAHANIQILSDQLRRQR